MRAVLPGKPRATLQAVCSARWSERQIVAYISGNTLVILDGPESLVQTICQDEVEQLDAVAIDTATGKLATSSGSEIFVYEPYGLEEYTKWSQQCSFAAFEREGEGREGSSSEDSHRINEAGHTHQPCTLSWGMPGELLVGGPSLKLYRLMSYGERPQLSWEAQLSSDAHQASFSSDADLVASIAQHDPLVKVWRRRWSGSGPDQSTFDFCYLPHPEPVTDFFWRKPEKRASQGGQHVLYTVSADKKLRVWAQLDHHSLQTLELWAELDLQDVIQPRHLSPESVSDKRSVFLIPGTDFDSTTKRALQRDVDPAKRPFLEHLAEIAAQKPDICVVVDGKGHMSAWGLQNIGSKRRKDSDIFNIALVEDFNLLDRVSGPASGNTGVHARFLTILKDATTPSFSVLVHYFDGAIVWMDGRMDELFDPAPSTRRLRRQALWTAHEQPIDKMVRNASGLSIISRSEQGEALVWRMRPSQAAASLQKVSSLQLDDALLGMCILDRGSHFVTLQDGKVCLWESASPEATQIACCSLKLPADPVRVIRVPSKMTNGASRFVAVLTASVEGAVFEVNIPRGHGSKQIKQGSANGVLNGVTNGAPNGTSRKSDECSIEFFCSIKQSEPLKYKAVSAVDPVGYSSSVPDSLDAFASDIALAHTDEGIVETFAAKLDTATKEISWLKTASINTGLPKLSLAVASSSRKVAIVDEAGTGLLIWDTRNGDLEFEQSFGVGEDIRDLDWTATPDAQSLLAVGFPHKVLVYGQMRYNYLNPEPAWAAIREIYIRDLTPHPIGDSTWLGGGSLVIGAGRQLFIYEDAISGQDKTVKDIPVATHVTSPGRLFSRVNLLNGPLPVFHPQFLTQAILAGRLGLAQQSVVRLHKALKFWTEGEDIDMTLGIPTDELLADEDPLSSQRAPKQRLQLDRDSNTPLEEEEEEETVTEELAAALNEKLTRTSLPYMSSQEQFYLSNLVESVALTEKHRRSVDINAARFITFFRQFMLIKVSEHQYRAGVTWREYSWAYHSNSQDILVDLVSKQYNGKMLWTNAREAGVFMWMSDISALRAQFEIVARNEYSKTDERNPVDCSLFYLALRKKNVLVGLWRMATWNREQAGTQKLLANNFTEARWRTAALKNAYALLGKRRFEYAAAFFLLADRLEDAVNVCVNQVGDVQLAVAVARVYEGDESPVLRKLLTTHVLPAASRSGDRWQASWAFWMLGRRDRAIRALITPIWTLLDLEDDYDNNDEEEEEDDGHLAPNSKRNGRAGRAGRSATPTPSPPATTMQSRSFLANDPALVSMYAQFRESSLQALQGSMQVSAREEREFVLRTARLYARMGCDWLALNLVRNWSFLLQQDEDEDEEVDVMGRMGVAASTTLAIRSGTRQDGKGEERAETEKISVSSPTIPDPRKLLRRRSSLVVDDLTAPTPKSPTLGMKSAASAAGAAGGTSTGSASMGGFGGFASGGGGGGGSEGGEGTTDNANDGTKKSGSSKTKAKPKPPPTMFEEPEANSLLDQFGF